MDVADFTCLQLNKHIRKRKKKSSNEMFQCSPVVVVSTAFLQRLTEGQSFRKPASASMCAFSPSLGKVEESPEQALFGSFKAIFIDHKIFEVFL